MSWQDSAVVCTTRRQCDHIRAGILLVTSSPRAILVLGRLHFLPTQCTRVLYSASKNFRHWPDRRSGVSRPGDRSCRQYGAWCVRAGMANDASGPRDIVAQQTIHQAHNHDDDSMGTVCVVVPSIAFLLTHRRQGRTSVEQRHTTRRSRRTVV